MNELINSVPLDVIYLTIFIVGLCAFLGIGAGVCHLFGWDEEE